jgi:hypothetical protein
MRGLFRGSQWNTIKSRARGGSLKSAAQSSASVLACETCQKAQAGRLRYVANAQQICFTNQPSFFQPLVVRTSFAVWLLLTAALCCVRAQDQEKKLLDRLLKPDMTLQNDAQNKKFSGDGLVSINKRANIGTFFVHKKPNLKDYFGTRDFSTTPFYSQTYRGGRTAHEVSLQPTLANSKATYADQTARSVRDAPQAGKKVASRAYAGNRPFLGEGTNQKSLNRKTEPLTIEQVRELLNKNK